MLRLCFVSCVCFESVPRIETVQGVHCCRACDKERTCDKKMELRQMFCIAFILVLLLLDVNNVNGQEASFDLPVQLVGFPFIIASVRLTNFLKKLTYSVSPATYRSRTRRQLTAEPIYDIQEVEKYIVSEFGARACIFERVCAHYAAKNREHPSKQMDWPEVFSQYKRSRDQDKEFYLLSVFLGDIVGSPQLCHQLGKRRSCEGDVAAR